MIEKTAKTPVKKTAVKAAAKPVTAKKPAVKKVAPTKTATAKTATAKTVKKTAVKTTVSKKPQIKDIMIEIIVSDGQRYRMVSEAAYYRAESNNFKSDPLCDWIEAERDIEILLNTKR